MDAEETTAVIRQLAHDVQRKLHRCQFFTTTPFRATLVVAPLVAYQSDPGTGDRRYGTQGRRQALPRAARPAVRARRSHAQRRAR